MELLDFVLKSILLIGIISCLYGSLELFLSVKTYPQGAKEGAFPIEIFPERFQKEIKGAIKEAESGEKRKALAVLNPKLAKEGILFIAAGFIAQFWAGFFLIF